MDNIIKISIIIPAYNVAEYINGMIDYLADNDLSDCEIIIVDDGSTDSTVDCIKKSDIVEKRLIEQDNAGVSVARNVGIDSAKGEYLLFLDGDDKIARDLLKKVKEKIDQYQADMIVWQHDIEREGKITRLDYCDLPEITTGIDFFCEFLYQKYRLCMGTFAIKKELLDAYNIRFTPGCNYAEDIEFLFFSLVMAHSVVVIDEILYTYVRHTGSAMYRYNIKRFDAPMAVMRVANRLERVLQEIGNKKELKFLSHEYFAKQFIYSLDSCLQYLNLEDFYMFWNDVERIYPGLLLRAQQMIRRIKRRDDLFEYKKLLIQRVSIKGYSWLVLYLKRRRRSTHD